MKLPDGQHRLEVRLKPEEAYGINRAARQVGLKDSTWLRSLAVQKLDELYGNAWRAGPQEGEDDL